MQLVNAITGSQLWTQTYDRAIQSDYLYEIFDDIIKQVVPKLVGYHGLISRNVAFSTQLDPLLDQDTIDAVFWYYHYQISYTEDVFQIARQRIEKAVQQNPNYALGWAILAQLYIDGGALDYVIQGKTGMFFAEQTVDSLCKAILESEEISFNHKAIQKHATTFAPSVFRHTLTELVEKVT